MDCDRKQLGRDEKMGIKEDFLDYAGNKWGASKFTDKFSLLFKTRDKTNGLWTLLWEMRQKTYNAIAALVDGKVDRDSVTENPTPDTISKRNNLGELFGTNIFSQSVKEVNLLAKDNDKWYPVSILQGHVTLNNCIKYRISKPFYGEAPNIGTGYFDIEVLNTSWGGNHPYQKVEAKGQRIDLLGGIRTDIDGFNDCGKHLVYLRGGSRYFFYAEFTQLGFIIDYTDPIVIGGASYPPISSPLKILNKGLNIEKVTSEGLKIKKSSTEAVIVTNDADQEVFSVDTINKKIKFLGNSITGFSMDFSGTIDTNGVIINKSTWIQNSFDAFGTHLVKFKALESPPHCSITATISHQDSFDYAYQEINNSAPSGADFWSTRGIKMTLLANGDIKIYTTIGAYTGMYRIFIRELI